MLHSIASYSSRRCSRASTRPALRAAVEDVLESAHAARWQVTRSERDALELVEHICRRFPRAALAARCQRA